MSWKKPKDEVSEKTLQDEMEKALHCGKDESAIAIEALTTPIQTGLPTHWQDAGGRTHLRGADTQIKVANHQEVASYAYAPTRVCGTCKYFTLQHARKQMVKENFLTRLVRENEWRTKYLGVPVDNIGLCGASDGSLATTSISSAYSCDQYRERLDVARKGGRA